MKFNDFDNLMRVFETKNDHCVPNDHWMVARLDGKGFTKFVKKENFKRPFSEQFNSMMTETMKYLMSKCGFNIVYGYTQSDEISLLFSKNEDVFKRKERKLISILAGEASAYFNFTYINNSIAVFDCRISDLPETKNVIDYFSWRYQDCERNSLNTCCHWTLINSGKFSPKAAYKKMFNLSIPDKIKLLMKYGIDYSKLEMWKRKGVCIKRVIEEFKGVDYITGSDVLVERNKLKIDKDLPEINIYRDDLKNFLETLK